MQNEFKLVNFIDLNAFRCLTSFQCQVSPKQRNNSSPREGFLTTQKSIPAVS